MKKSATDRSGKISGTKIPCISLASPQETLAHESSQNGRKKREQMERKVAFNRGATP